MTAVTIVLSLLLALVCVYTSMFDFRNDPRALETMARINCPYPLKFLASVKLLAAAGLIVGVWLEWLGSITLICLAGYFFIGAAYHRKAKDSVANTAPAAVLCLVATIGFIISIIAK